MVAACRHRYMLLFLGACLSSRLFAEESPAVPPAERTFRVIRGKESPDKRFALGVTLKNFKVVAGAGFEPATFRL